jgi:hypothetical protein
MVYRDPIEMVNDYILRFGQAVAVPFDPLDEGGYTDVRFESLLIGINVVVEHGVLLILARMGGVPAIGRERLYRKLLEMNFLATAGLSFAIDDERDAVYLRALRPLAGLDYEDFAGLLETTAKVASKLRPRVPELSST